MHSAQSKSTPSQTSKMLLKVCAFTILFRVSASSNYDGCRCVPASHCADGGSAIRPRVNESEPIPTGMFKHKPDCEEGYRYCCVIVTPKTTLPPLPPCGIREPRHIPGFHPGDRDLATYSEFPWMVRILGPHGKFIGTGALISENKVATVTHILKTIYSGSKLSVELGTWNDAVFVVPHEIVKIGVSHWKEHKGYNDVNLHNDIAVLHLDEPVDLRELHPHIGTVCPPSASPHHFHGKRCFLSTFGNEHLPILRKIEMPIVDNNKCENIFRNTILGRSFLLDKDSFMCAGGEPGRDACKGHGGAPLVCEFHDRFELVGLVAWGLTDDDCKDKGHLPGVYVNVHSYREFLEI